MPLAECQGAGGDHTGTVWKNPQTTPACPRFLLFLHDGTQLIQNSRRELAAQACLSAEGRQGFWQASRRGRHVRLILSAQGWIPSQQCLGQLCGVGKAYLYRQLTSLADHYIIEKRCLPAPPGEMYQSVCLETACLCGQAIAVFQGFHRDLDRQRSILAGREKHGGSLSYCPGSMETGNLRSGSMNASRDGKPRRRAIGVTPGEDMHRPAVISQATIRRGVWLRLVGTVLSSIVLAQRARPTIQSPSLGGSGDCRSGETTKTVCAGSRRVAGVPGDRARIGLYM